MAIYGYLREPLITHNDDPFATLDAQERMIIHYASMRSLIIDQIFVETGRVANLPMTERKVGTVLFKTVKSGDTIITPTMDRMFKDASGAADGWQWLIKKGVLLVMLDLINISIGTFIAIAAAQRVIFRERMSVVKTKSRAKKTYAGGNPKPLGVKMVAGFEERMVKVTKMERDSVQCAILQEAYRMRQAGEKLNAIHRMTVDRNCKISRAAIHKFLQNPSPEILAA